jgi:NADPH:quinone reductase-like Zn-dependent oxidoreductase
MAAPGGRILITAGREPQPPTPLWPLYTNDISVTGFVISRAATAELAAAARAINDRLSSGADFALTISDVLPLDQTAQAHTRVESGESGRIVIKVAD